MGQRNHPVFAQAQGAPAGFVLPALVLTDAKARYYFEDVPQTPIDIVLQPTTGFVRVSAIGGALLLRSNLNVSASQAVKATAILTLTGVIVPGSHAESVITSDTTEVVDGDTVTIGSTVYRFKNTMALAYDVKRTGTAALTLDNLKAAINASGTAGVEYFAGTLAHPTVVATTNTDTTQKIVARVPGIAANTLATTENSIHLSWPAATLGDGTGASNPGVTTAVATVTVREETYTFVDVLSETNGAAAIANQILFGADSAAALDNLKLAINAGATAGTNYSTGTGQPDDVIATTNTDTTQVFEAQTLGTPGNVYTASETLSNGTISALFSGGSEGANFDAVIPAGTTYEMGVDEDVAAISIIAVAASTDVGVTEH